MIKVLITGGNGQLASCIKAISSGHLSKIAFTYRSSAQLNITDLNALIKEFKTGGFDYCINCAAYTNVDASEKNSDLAHSINHVGVKNIAEVCAINNTILIHISTDFVFDGLQSLPYKEEEQTNSQSVYGRSKLLGEKEIESICHKHFIIRTSWLYSEYGNNFMKSMLKYGVERKELSVVFDQIGTPTYAIDLASFLLFLIEKRTTSFGTYHYSNEGVASWYDFAKAIFEINEIVVMLNPIRTSEYPLPAKRPSYSILDKSKIKEQFHLQIPHWKDSLIVASESLKIKNKIKT